MFFYSSLHYGGHLLLEIVIVANYNNKPNMVGFLNLNYPQHLCFFFYMWCLRVVQAGSGGSAGRKNAQAKMGKDTSASEESAGRSDAEPICCIDSSL